MNLMQAMKIAEAGFQRWAEKPHNRKWAKKIDGTPIPNDLVVNMAEAFSEALPREGQGEAQVFTYEHSAMGGGMYATTISNDPPPPNLWCRIKKFSPATLSPSPAVRDGVVEALREALVVIDADADVETWNRVNAALRALSTQEQGNG